MANQSLNLEIYVDNYADNPSISAFQWEKSKTDTVNLKNAGKPYNLSQTTIALQALDNEGFLVAATCTVQDAVNGIFEIQYDDNFFGNPGTFKKSKLIFTRKGVITNTLDLKISVTAQAPSGGSGGGGDGGITEITSSDGSLVIDDISQTETDITLSDTALEDYATTEYVDGQISTVTSRLGDVSAALTTILGV